MKARGWRFQIYKSKRHAPFADETKQQLWFLAFTMAKKDLLQFEKKEGVGVCTRLSIVS
jgi:hypothetical protein